MKKLKHRNVVRYIDSFVDRDYLYLVMEYCTRGDLQEYLNRMGPNLIPEPRIWKFVI